MADTKTQVLVLELKNQIGAFLIVIAANTTKFLENLSVQKLNLLNIL